MYLVADFSINHSGIAAANLNKATTAPFND
jgi:hypothetical protein